MAMFLFPHNGLVLLLIGYITVLIQNGLNANTMTVDAARGNVLIPSKFIQIQKPPFKRLLISKPHVSHYLPCTASIQQGIHETIISVESFNYTWFRNGKELQTFTSRRGDFQLLPNGTLRLPTNEKATGVYRCLVNATDKGLHALLSESCSVDYPVFKRVQTKLNVTATIGDPLTLSCPVISVPTANISWLFRNTSIERRLKESRFTTLTNGSLVLKNVTENDRGMYKCIAQNSYATKTHRHILITVNIISRTTENNLSTSLLKYKLLPPLQDEVHYIPSSTDLQLRCLGNSNTIAIEWWFRKTLNDQPAKLSNNSMNYYIRKATVANDDGYYTCTTKNDSQTFQVIVTDPPVFTQKLKSYNSALAAFVNFSCIAKGNPQPEFTWYRNGKLLNGDSYTINIQKNILTIQSFDVLDEGIYQCFAKNIAGETYSAALLQLSGSNTLDMPKTLKNVKCYALNFNTINITFSSNSNSSYFISVHFAQKTPYSWESKPPQQLNNTDYVIISGHMPTYKPFVILTRTMISMPFYPYNKDKNETTMNISPLSDPAFCCTQGLPIHAFHVSADVIVTWTNQPLKTKYFIVQFSTAFTRPHPKDFFENTNIQGISSAVVLRNDHEDIHNHLQDVIPLTESQARDVLSKTQSIRNDSDDTYPDEDVFSLVVPSNVTGILLKKCQRAKIRILVVTNETENLKQDFRYVQWKIIENNTEEALVRVLHLGSRSITFLFKDTFEEECVQVCNFVYDMKDTGYSNRNFCHDKTLMSSRVNLSGLKPTKNYKTQFYSCGNVHNLLAEIDVRTLPDPPGTITNQKVTKQNGLKLSWNPPTNPNGKIYHYNILWTVKNITHEANVSSSETYFKFPNITEREKINITVRVFGENGMSAPIYIDLRNVRHEHLEIERTSLMDTYWGIAIGAALSFLCVLIFSLVCIYQRHRFKMHSGQTQLSSQSESNIGAVSTPGVGGGTEITGLGRFLGDSGGGMGESGTLSEYHEMQTLIPKTQNFQILTDIPSPVLPKQLPNGNGNCPRREDITDYISAETPLNEEPVALCSSTPLAPRQPSDNGDIGNEDTLYFIPVATKNIRRDIAADFRPPPLSPHQSSRFALNKISSSPNFFNSGASSSVGGGCRPSALIEDCSRQSHTNHHSQWQPATLQNGCSHYVNTAKNRNSFSSSSNNSKTQLPPPTPLSHQLNHSADNGFASLSEPKLYAINSGQKIVGDSKNQLFSRGTRELGDSSRPQPINNPSLDRNDGNFRISTLTPIANNNNTLSWHNKQVAPNDLSINQILYRQNSSTAPLIDNNSTIGSEPFSSPAAVAVSDSHPSVSGYSSTSSHHSNPPTNHHNQEADNSSNPLLKTNWSHRRPNVDPNG